MEEYELIRKLGAGGMAEVYLARQRRAAGFFRELVIKRLFPHLAGNERALRMFQDEARLLARLSHPNIPQVHDLGQTAGGSWYAAMEYVPGFTLAELQAASAQTSTRLPLGVALGIVTQTCEALHHAHERLDHEGRPLRIVHRDVTPDNVMITLDGVVKMVDFGVAQSTQRLDEERSAVGTYAYMAPEQVRGLLVDKRADVFALGVLLWELTLGARLFDGVDVQVLTSIVERDAPAPSSVQPDYPPELERTVRSALVRNRAKRTPSAGRLAMELEHFALRHGLSMGQRVIARHMHRVFPREQVAQKGRDVASSAAAPSWPPAGGSPGMPTPSRVVAVKRDPLVPPGTPQSGPHPPTTRRVASGPPTTQRMPSAPPSTRRMPSVQTPAKPRVRSR